MRRSTLVDDLVLEYASPRTQRLLREYDAQTQVGALMLRDYPVLCAAAGSWRPRAQMRVFARRRLCCHGRGCLQMHIYLHVPNCWSTSCL